MYITTAKSTMRIWAVCASRFFLLIFKNAAHIEKLAIVCSFFAKAPQPLTPGSGRFFSLRLAINQPKMNRLPMSWDEFEPNLYPLFFRQRIENYFIKGRADEE